MEDVVQTAEESSEKLPVPSTQESITQTPLVLSTEKQKKRMSWKRTIFLLLVVFCTVALVAFSILNIQGTKSLTKETEDLFPSLTQEPTIDIPKTSYTTYTGDGFSLELPSNWSNLSSPCERLEIRFIPSSESSLTSFVLKEGFVNESNLTQNIEAAKKDGFIDFKNISMGNVIIVGAQGLGELNNIYIKSANGYYHITVWYQGPVDGTGAAVCPKADEYKSILSTFKLLDKKVSTSVGWKTYTDEIYGYSISYPSDVYTRIICPGEEQKKFMLMQKDSVNNTDPIRPASCGRDWPFSLEIHPDKKDVYAPQADSDVDVISQNIYIGDVSAKKYISTQLIDYPGPNWFIMVAATHKNKNFELFYRGNCGDQGADTTSCTKEFDQIIKTWKFNN